VVFLACVHLTLFLGLSLSPGNCLVFEWCDRSMLASLLCHCLTVPFLLQLCNEPTCIIYNNNFRILHIIVLRFYGVQNVVVRRRKNSLQGSMTAGAVSPASSPQLGPARPMAHLVATAPDTHTATPPGSPTVSSVAWRARLHSIKNNFLGSPRFHRKKLQGCRLFSAANVSCRRLIE